jgi:copper chaperone CopZ
LGSILAGVVFEQLISGAGQVHMEHEHGTPVWKLFSQVCGVGLIAWLGKFAWGDFRAAVSSFFPATKDSSAAVQTFTIEGMTCNGCVKKLRGKLESDAKVDTADVTLEPPQAVVRGDVEESTIRQLTKEAGFRVINPE